MRLIELLFGRKYQLSGDFCLAGSASWQTLEKQFRAGGLFRRRRAKVKIGPHVLRLTVDLGKPLPFDIDMTRKHKGTAFYCDTITVNHAPHGWLRHRAWPCHFAG